MLSTFAIAAALVGVVAGAFAGSDGTRFFLGFGYAFALVVAVVVVILISTALFAGESFVLRFSSAAMLLGVTVFSFGAIAFVSYSAAFGIARHLKTRHAANRAA